METRNELTSYYLHFLNGNKKCIENSERKIKIKKNKKLNNDYDKLFFNFLLIAQFDALTPNHNKTVETQLKYEYAHKMEHVKIKKIDDVVNNLCYENEINLHSLSALCLLCNKTMIYRHEHIFICLNNCQTSDIVFIVTINKDIIHMKRDKINFDNDKHYEILNIHKPMYCCSHYKLNELKEIAKRIGITIDDKSKKSEIYNEINHYLSRVIF